MLVANKGDGATTVAATMIIADMANIRVFATGGIGGVHRDAPLTMDISADLEELGRTTGAVVCAGVKSILDIGLTLEYLETKGVPVIGYCTNQMPAFYTDRSGYLTDYARYSPKEIANALEAKLRLGISGGMLIANPIPKDYSMDKNTIDAVIDNALETARQLQIKGKAVTPYLLSAVKEITHGKSLEANIALVYNNVALAAQIAYEFHR